MSEKFIFVGIFVIWT